MLVMFSGDDFSRLSKVNPSARMTWANALVQQTETTSAGLSGGEFARLKGALVSVQPE